MYLGVHIFAPNKTIKGDVGGNLRSPNDAFVHYVSGINYVGWRILVHVGKFVTGIIVYAAIIGVVI